jgi:hypothetical protein
MTPTWPQLAGWLATAHVETAYGTATGPQLGGDLRFAIDGDRLELRWADGRRFADDGTRAVLVQTDGTATLHRDGEAGALRRLLCRRGAAANPIEALNRGDYHRAAGPPRPATVAGRTGWAVDLIAPPRKRGHWQLVVDDETGCVLSSAHDELGPNARITALTLAADPLADYGYAGPRPEDPTARGRHETALFEAGRSPTVHVNPRGYFPNVVHAAGDRVLVELDAEHPGLSLSVAPVGQQPLDPGPFATHHHTRTVGDHIWTVATYDEISATDAERILAATTWV